MKEVIVHSREEAHRLRELNEEYRQSRRYWKRVKIVEPNALWFLRSRVDKCPRCGSSNIQELRCVSCGHSDVKCLDCKAYWQMNLPEKGKE